MKSLIALLTFFISCLFIGSAWGITYDFGNGLDDWIIIWGGIWGISDGELVQSAPRSFSQALVGDGKWTDYTVKCKIMVTDGTAETAGVVFRAMMDNQKYYVFYIAVGSGNVMLAQFTDQGCITKFRQPVRGGVTLRKNEWYTVRIVVEHDEAKYYVNDELQGRSDDLQYDKGRIGVAVWGASAHFDDLSVSGPGIAEISVRPKAKTAVVWGDMKMPTRDSDNKAQSCP